MRRPAGRDEMNFVEIETPVRGPCHGQMPGMNRIKRAAEKCNSPGMVLSGCAVGLRCRQSASRMFPNPILSRNSVPGVCFIARFPNHPGSLHPPNPELLHAHLLPELLFLLRVLPSESYLVRRP